MEDMPYVLELIPLYIALIAYIIVEEKEFWFPPDSPEDSQETQIIY